MLLVGRLYSDGFVELNDTVMEDWLDGGKEVGDVGLVGDVLSVSLWENKAGGLNRLVEGNDPIPMGSNRLGDLR